MSEAEAYDLLQDLLAKAEELMASGHYDASELLWELQMRGIE